MHAAVSGKRHRLLNLGCYFCLLSLALYVASATIPDLWIYERQSKDSTEHYGRSIWNFSLRVCYDSNSGGWKCSDKLAKPGTLLASSSCLCLAIVAQLLACIVLMVNRVSNTQFLFRCLPECLSGLSAQLALTSILIYVSVTYYAKNVTYGPTFDLTMAGVLLAYSGLLLTGLNAVPTAHAKKNQPTSTAG